MPKRDDWAEPITEVPLRKRSTPYEFQVKMIHEDRSLGLYDGKSHNYARVLYWQAIHTLHFLHSSGKVFIEITKAKNPYGGFSTEFVAGRAVSLHKATGNCIEWTRIRFSLDNLAEKMLSTIPGTLGLPRDQSEPPTFQSS